MGWSPFRKTGLSFHSPAQSYKGYTLVTPIGGSNATYLIDMAGQIVHRWKSEVYSPFYARLLPNGSLLAAATSFATARAATQQPGHGRPPFGPDHTHILELDWEGNITWEYANDAAHHDFIRLPSGNTIVTLTVDVPAEIASRVRGGYRERPQPPMISDDLVEVDPAGKEVKRVSLWHLFDPARDPICPLESRASWTHLNGLDLTREGGVIFSCRNNSRIGTVDWQSGKLVWKYGNPDLSHQHCPTSQPNGNVMIFNNGPHRLGMPRSSIMEINPRDNSLAWSYTATPEVQFFSSHISGAERQPNDNVLICEGAVGRVFEVTRRGEIVWEWTSPFAQGTGAMFRSWLFRAHRYGPDYPGLAGRDLDPARHADLNRLYGLEA